MNLIILIPAYNEEEKISEVIKSIPKNISNIKNVKILVIDDGSNDNTVNLATRAGADRVVKHSSNMGVGAAFMTGVRNAINMKADILVTLDADSQFDSTEIENLILPLINKELDVVIGSRFLKEISNMPKVKFFGNKVFSKIVSWCTSQKFTDSQTGFRAYSRNAIMRISVVNNFTYTQEVLIDLKFKGMRIGEIPVSVKYDDVRKSRVVKNVFDYSYKALSIIARTLVFHRPIFTFGVMSSILILSGFFSKLVTTTGIFHVSAGLSTGLIILGIVSIMIGLFANMVFKRQLFAENDLRHYIDNLNSKE